VEVFAGVRSSDRLLRRSSLISNISKMTKGPRTEVCLADSDGRNSLTTKPRLVAAA